MLGPIIATTAAVIGGGLLEKATEKITSKVLGDNITSKIGKVGETFDKLLSAQESASSKFSILDYVQSIDTQNISELEDTTKSLIEDLKNGLEFQLGEESENCLIKRNENGSLTLITDKGVEIPLNPNTEAHQTAEKILALNKLKEIRTTQTAGSVRDLAQLLTDNKEGLWKINFDDLDKS